MAGSFTSPDGDLESLFVNDTSIIDDIVKTNLYVWGQDYYGQLGDNNSGTGTYKSTPIQTLAGGINWKYVVGNYKSSYGIKTDNSLWSWGDNAQGQLGDSTTTAKLSPIQIPTSSVKWKQISSRWQHVFGIKVDGTLWGWGDNGNGQLGTNSMATSYSSPVQTVAAGTNWKLVSTGDAFTIAIKTDGTLWTWGNNGQGQLGDNTSNQQSSPVQTVTSGTNWNTCAGGGSHAGAIKTDGTLWLWGAGYYGALGNNTSGFPTNRVSSPVQTSAGGTNWQSVACGYQHTSAIKTDGTLWMWGKNNYGQIGNNNSTNTLTPVQTIAAGTNWKQVACGQYFTTAIKTNGTLWSWGRNLAGELSDNTTTHRSSPVVAVGNNSYWKLVSAGAYHTVARAT
jgi:alpha-tubulin suppressor-like RCC1 family protein